MDCCTAHDPASMFGERFARRVARRYREHGLDDDARWLVDAVAGGSAAGKTVLDVGGGVGELQLELLKAGAERGVLVEVVEAYRPHARELAEEAGVAGRSEFRLADLLDDPTGAPESDLVVLNRVVCCTPEGPRLLGIAARAAREALALSYPRDTWLARLAIGIENLGLRIIRRPFRAYVHDPSELAAAAVSAGLTPGPVRTGRIWELAAFRRA